MLTLSRHTEFSPCLHLLRTRGGSILRSRAAGLLGGSREGREGGRLRGDGPTVSHQRSGRCLGPACQGGSSSAARTSRKGRMTPSEPLIPLTAYCRTSTDDQQNPEESLRWQLSRASALIVGRAQIVSVTHDTDVSRSVPWPRRPEAAQLIAQLPNAARGWTGIVVGEPQRAFGSAGQVQNILPELAHWGVQLWVPEVGGPVDPESEAHDLLISLFGGLSKAERNRLRVRVRTSVKAMAPEGRYLGGRPLGHRRTPTRVPRRRCVSSLSAQRGG